MEDKMKAVYPVIITEQKGDIPYLVYIPDFDAYTQGESLSDAIYMAEDLIALSGVDLEDDGNPIPEPSRIEKIDIKASPWSDDADDILSEIKNLVTVDFDLYRKKLKNTAVRRNVSLPAWLDAEASKAGVNVSAILQTALKQELHIS
jgi:predicted RNase H-like HicB family nuclease